MRFWLFIIYKNNPTGFLKQNKYYYLRQSTNILGIETWSFTRLPCQEPVSIALFPAINKALAYTILVVIIPSGLLGLSLTRVFALKTELKLEFFLKEKQSSINNLLYNSKLCVCLSFCYLRISVHQRPSISNHKEICIAIFATFATVFDFDMHFLKK